MSSCHDFRQRLLQAVLDHDALAPLSWDAHVLHCGTCRALIESEEQLDHLLAAWQAPRLDASTRERILALVARERQLDALLDEHARLDSSTRAPRALVSRVLAALARRLAAEAPVPDPLDDLLAAERVEAPAGLAGRTKAALRRRLAAVPSDEERLDLLLDLDRAPAPPGLAARVRAAVKQAGHAAGTSEAAAAPRRPLYAVVRGFAWFATAAAAAVVAYLWLGRDQQPAPRRVAAPETRPLVRPEEDLPSSQAAGPLVASTLLDDRTIDERMLGQLETLEEIEALLGGDVDLMLSTMDASEEALLDLAPGDDATATEEPKKG